jgi:hypothetical protein
MEQQFICQVIGNVMLCIKMPKMENLSNKIMNEKPIQFAKINKDAVRHHFETIKNHKDGDFVKARESSLKAIEFQGFVCEHSAE